MISKKEGKKKQNERGRKVEKSGGEESYKSPWSPIKFMNPDLDRSPIVTALEFFFFFPRSFDTFFVFSSLPFIQIKVWILCNIEYAISQSLVQSKELILSNLRTIANFNHLHR